MKFLTKCLGLSLLFHILAGVLSIGFYDMDEHFQILEYMNYRLGRIDSKHLAWEFHYQMRSWVQPMLYEGLTRILVFMGIESPFQWATWIRIISSLLGWGSLVGLSLCCYRWFKTEALRKAAILSLCVFWSLPYLHARTSSENLSGTAFWYATSVYVLGSGRRYLVLFGFLLGLSFDFRFQMGIAIAAFLIWMKFINNNSVSALIKSLAGILLALSLELCLDFLGYQKWVVAPYNYLYQNLVLGKAAQFGISPPWFYFQDLLNILPPFGILIGIGVVSCWIFYPTYLLSILSGAFVLVHSLLGHKEQRFLYPLLPIVPVLCVMGFQGWRHWMMKRNLWNFQGRTLRITQVVASILLVYDLGALSVASLKPSSSQPNFYQAVFDQEPRIKNLYYLGGDPYDVGGNEVYFYRHPELKLHHFALSEFKGETPTEPFWVFHDQFELPSEINQSLMRSHPPCQLVYTVYPNWLRYLSFLPGPGKFASRWSLFRCSGDREGSL